MIHVLNNLPKEYDVILDELENHLTATGQNAFTIDSISEELNHRYEKIKSKKKGKNENEKALNVYNKQYKQRCWQCGKYGHKRGDQRCFENKNEKEENEKKVELKIGSLKEYATTVDRKGILVEIVGRGETAIIFGKAKRAQVNVNKK